MIAHRTRSAPAASPRGGLGWTGRYRLSALETLVIIALYKSTFTVPLPYHIPLLLEVAPETDTNPTSF